MRTTSLFLLLASTLPGLGHEGHGEGTPHEMEQAATAFLSSLADEQKEQAAIPFTNDERENWHFVPLDTRKGVRLGDLTPGQVPLAYAFLGTGLSDYGLRTAGSIMSLEQYLADKENNPQMRNPQKYYFSVFGEPAADAPWGWRFEGHHLSLNYTILDAEHFAFTPAFFGTNPAELPDGPRKGARPLGDIEDKARALALAISRSHPGIVFTDRAPNDIITSQDRAAKPLPKQGVSTQDLSAEQRSSLVAVINRATSLLDVETGAQAPLPGWRDLAGKELWFGWAGSLERGAAHYFRIQAGDLLLEYANTQNNANHAHLVIRSLKNDFGRDLLKEHFEREH